MSARNPIEQDLPPADTVEEYDPDSDPNLKRARKWCPRCEQEYEGYVWAALVPVSATVERTDKQGRVIGICVRCGREIDAAEHRTGRGRHGWLDEHRALRPPRTTFGDQDDD